MVDPGIGRLLLASLHQGIADAAPSRLEFYENWLSPTGLRDGRLGLAPLGAVLSFLQREEPPSDQTIPVRAGTCAAVWTYESTSTFRRRVIPRLPPGWRTRAALGLGRALVLGTISRSRITIHLQRGQGTIDIRSPLFDYLRGSSGMPMRRYYAAAYTECLRLCDLAGVVNVDESAAGCRLSIDLNGAPVPASPPAAG